MMFVGYKDFIKAEGDEEVHQDRVGINQSNIISREVEVGAQEMHALGERIPCLRDQIQSVNRVKRMRISISGL